MTNGTNELLLFVLGGLVLSIVLFSLQRRRKLEYIMLGVGLLLMLATLAFIMLDQGFEPTQTAFATDQQSGAGALLLPSTSTETQAPPDPSAKPEEPASSTMAAAPAAAETAGASLDTGTPRPPEDEAPSTVPVPATSEPVPEPLGIPTATFGPTPLPPAPAIVRAFGVNVREGPSAGRDPESGEDIYKSILTKRRGEVLEVIGRGILDDPWVQVRLEGDRTGWVRTAPGFVELTGPIETLPLVGWYPPTGVLQKTIPLDGPHTLEVVNEGEQDVVIALAQDGNPVVVLHVRAGGKYTAVGIPDGTYEVFDSRGANWNGREFMTDAQRTRRYELLPFALGESGNPVTGILTIDSTTCWRRPGSSNCWS